MPIFVGTSQNIAPGIKQICNDGFFPGIGLVYQFIVGHHGQIPWAMYLLHFSKNSLKIVLFLIARKSFLCYDLPIHFEKRLSNWKQGKSPGKNTTADFIAISSSILLQRWKKVPPWKLSDILIETLKEDKLNNDY